MRQIIRPFPTRPARRNRPRLLAGHIERLESRELLTLAYGNALGLGVNTEGVVSINGNSVAVDSSGNRYVAGSFSGVVNLGGNILVSHGGRDAYIAKYDPAGNLVFARTAGGVLDDVAESVAVDASGNAYVTGEFNGAVAFGNSNVVTSGPGGGVFLWKLTPGGTNTFVVTGSAAAGSQAGSSSVSVTPDGSMIALGGSVRGSFTFGNSTVVTSSGNPQGFVASLDASGRPTWLSSFSGAAGSSSAITGVTFDPSGNVGASGRFSGTVDFDPLAGYAPRTSTGGSSDLAIVSLGRWDGGLIFADTTGGAGNDAATGIVAGAGGKYYVVGSYQQTVNFAPGRAAQTLTAPSASTNFYLISVYSNGAVAYLDDLGASNPDAAGVNVGRPGVAINASGLVAASATYGGIARAGRYVLSAGSSIHALVETFDASGRIIQALANGGNNNSANGLALDDSGRVTLAGDFSDLLNVGGVGLQDTYHGSTPNSDAYLATFKPVLEVQNDFYGVKHTEPAVVNRSTYQWTVLGPGGATPYVKFGVAGDVPVSADLDLYGVSRPAVYRPSTSQWIVSGLGADKVVAVFGGPNDVPVPGDYDGVGYAEPAVYRPSTGQWFVLGPNGGRVLASFGAPGSSDVPVPGDYDGVGRAEPAFFRPTTGQWFVLGPNGGRLMGTFGDTNFIDLPVPGDYDGVGRTELAVFRPSTSQWFVLAPGGAKVYATFGAKNLTDVPAEGSIAGMAVGSPKASGIPVPGTFIASPSPTTLTTSTTTTTPKIHHGAHHPRPRIASHRPRPNQLTR